MAGDIAEEMAEVRDGQVQPATSTTFGSKEAWRAWMSKIDDANKREKDYRKDGNKCVRLYEAQENVREPFAILYSNTETMQPAIYNARPIPVVERRFKDADPVGKAAAEVSTRILKYLIEAENEEYDSFDELMQPAVLETLITNRGVTRFKYVPHFTTDEMGQQAIASECVYGEAVRWDKILHGYARTWKKVPWVSFEWDMDPEEIKKNYPEVEGKVEFTEARADGGDGSPEKKSELAGVKLAKVYEIWDKETGKIYFLTPNYTEGFLKEPIDNPLKLSGFYPIPKPMNFMRKVSTLVPTPLYMQYQAQAQELNKLTVRLKALIDGLRIRGFYNTTVEDIEKVLKAEDNELIPLTNLSAMPDGMGVDKLIYLMPLAEIAQVVQALYLQREQCKQVIYEITGVSDILRGNSVASETATAQNIKNQWGTLRLKKMQKEAQRYCRDSLRITLEIAVNTFSQETIKKMTGLDYPTAEQKQQVQQQVQQMTATAQQQMQMGQQPAPPPPIPPELSEMMAKPTWEDIVKLLKDEVTRSYRVDIETNSTVDVEATADKQDISELLNSLSQFLNGVAPLIQQGTLPFEVAQQMLLAVARRYTFGSQLEEQLLKMKAPQPQADPTAEAKAAAEKQKMDGEAAKQKMEMEKMQMELEIAKAEAALRMEEMKLEFAIKQAEMIMRQQEIALQGREMAQKAEFASHNHGLKMEAATTKAREAKQKEPA